VPAEDARQLLSQLCDDLRLLRLQAGGPSLRGLAARLRLGKSQVGSILNGHIGRLPDWEVVRGLVDGCRQYAQDHGRLGQLSVATGIEQFWRPRYALVEYALHQPANRRPAAADPGSGADPGPPPAVTRAPVAPVPRQLPAPARHFAGRADALATLARLLQQTRNSTVTVAITGTAGVGKSTLAGYWAHQVADRFPDGLLYANLLGFGPSGPAVQPGTVIHRFLDAIGVPARRIPADPQARAALYRTELAGRRMLILLDNARDSAQVRPLLPGAAGCLVLVTSRDPLTGLVALDDAHPVALDVLSRDEAGELLARRLGRARVAGEPRPVEEIISSCARLPLALAIVAATAATRPVPLRTLAEQLRDGGRRTDLLRAGDPSTDIHAVFAWSYRTLTAPAARVFRLLGRHPGPDITAPAMVSLAGPAPPEVPPLLAELVQANLLTEPVPGRYACHDLLRAYASHLGDTLDAATNRTATTRVLDHYLHTAAAADRLLYPGRDLVRLEPPGAGTVPEPLADRDEALHWLTAERQVLLATVDRAAASGQYRHTWQLAWAVTGFLEHHRCWADQAAVAAAAIGAARGLDDPYAAGLGHRALARAYIETGRHRDAGTQLALALGCGSGDPVGQAHTYHHLAYLCERQSRHAPALDHTERALALYRRAGHRHGQAAALNAIGWYRTQLGDHAGALPACQQALTLLQELDNRAGQAATWDSLGYAHHRLGDHASAVTCYRRALALYRELGERRHEADTLGRLADSYQSAGRPHASRVTRRRAMAILVELDA
jgi:tetratricopeptide (TPR) repeat protein